jgi:formylmethanofuran dehydrogenase subunit E
LDAEAISRFIEECSAHHRHLCPRQVMGVRIGMAGAAGLGLEVPRRDKRLLVIVESDGCFVDGVSAATGCSVGHRTLRVEDYGKVAATFVDVSSELALRVAPRSEVRKLAWEYAPGETRRYDAQLHGYRLMPDEILLSIQEVALTTPVKTLISRPGVRVSCAACEEEITNEREVHVNGACLCKACAGEAYYRNSEKRYLVRATPEPSTFFRDL